MRSDIGLSNFGLRQNDLMKLMTKDIHEYDAWISGRIPVLGQQPEQRP
jgi:hypothetical protein